MRFLSRCLGSVTADDFIMLHLLKACRNGEVDCIAVQTKAYLAANSEEFCYLLKFLSEMPGLIELVTEDEKYHINTIMNPEQQKEPLPVYWQHRQLLEVFLSSF